MKPIPLFRRGFSLLVLFAASLSPLTAQSLLYAQHDGKLHLVRAARGPRALVEIKGKLVPANGQNFSLQKYDSYQPVLISVRDTEVRISFRMQGPAVSINHDFHFGATFETSYLLENVVLVLALELKAAGKLLFIYGLGQMKPHQPVPISVTVPMTGDLGEGGYQLHLFSNGLEVLQSEMPPDYRDAVVDQMTARQIAGVQEAGPKLLAGPTPEYPAALRKAGITGEVVVTIRIGANGRVYDPTIKQASHPLLGESALTAVRLWRFLPRVKNGAPVEATVDVPLDFTPPAPLAK